MRGKQLGGLVVRDLEKNELRFDDEVDMAVGAG
jgi:hypothetical protein